MSPSESVALGALIATSLVLLLLVCVLLGAAWGAWRFASRTAALTVERREGRLQFTGAVVATENVAAVVTELELAQANDTAERAKRPLLSPRANGSTRTEERPS